MNQNITIKQNDIFYAPRFHFFFPKNNLGWERLETWVDFLLGPRSF